MWEKTPADEAAKKRQISRSANYPQLLIKRPFFEVNPGGIK